MMKFQFETFADFMTMSGHGPYVWASYGITTFALAWLFVVPVLQKREFLKQQQKLQTLAQQNAEGQ
jgi:heme exporter protein D